FHPGLWRILANSQVRARKNGKKPNGSRVLRVRNLADMGWRMERAGRVVMACRLRSANHFDVARSSRRAGERDKGRGGPGEQSPGATRPYLPPMSPVHPRVGVARLHLYLDNSHPASASAGTRPNSSNSTDWIARLIREWLAQFSQQLLDAPRRSGMPLPP